VQKGLLFWLQTRKRCDKKAGMAGAGSNGRWRMRPPVESAPWGTEHGSHGCRRADGRRQKGVPAHEISGEG